MQALAVLTIVTKETTDLKRAVVAVSLVDSRLANIYVPFFLIQMYV